MHLTCKRTLFTLLIFILLLSGCSSIRMNNNINVSLKVVDENNNVIPYTSVWGYIWPIKSELAITDKDLWNVTNQFFSTHEFAVSHRILQDLIIFPMTNEQGKVELNLNYQYYEGSHAKIPKNIEIGFTILKHGYHPSIVKFSTKDGYSFNHKITLKRNTESIIKISDHTLKYDRLRYELSDSNKNSDMSLKNYHRLENIKKELLEIASSTDNVMAARIYSRMQYLPLIKIHNGRVIGYSQDNSNSKEAFEYLEKAYKLDSNNPYIASRYLFKIGAKNFGGNKYNSSTATEKKKKEFSIYFEKIKKLMESNGKEIWPTFHVLYALWHRKLSVKTADEQAKKLLEDFYIWMPKYRPKKEIFWMFSMKN